MTQDIKRAETAKYNDICRIALSQNRDYITPEDVSDAYKNGIKEDKICKDVLEVIGTGTGFGIEEYRLCAFVAFAGYVK